MGEHSQSTTLIGIWKFSKSWISTSQNSRLGSSHEEALFVAGFVVGLGSDIPRHRNDDILTLFEAKITT